MSGLAASFDRLSHLTGLLFWDRVLDGLGWLRTYYVARDGLELWTLPPQQALPQPPTYSPFFFFLNRENPSGLEPLLGYRIWIELNNSLSFALSVSLVSGFPIYSKCLQAFIWYGSLFKKQNEL